MTADPARGQIIHKAIYKNCGFGYKYVVHIETESTQTIADKGGVSWALAPAKK